MEIQSCGATREVTGSCHLITIAGKRILLDCGLIQGRAKDEARNRDPFPFDAARLDAVILSHAHIDHSGRLPLLIKAGFTGPIYTHTASAELCATLLKDSAYLNYKNTQWENKRRQRQGKKLLEPLYDRDDAAKALGQFETLEYRQKKEIAEGISIRLSDAGHIVGSSIVEIWLTEGSQQRKVVFSGDLGHRGTAILKDFTMIDDADLVLMESTYGNRLHRPWQETWDEIDDIVAQIRKKPGNVLIPAFSVGRTQNILYMFARNYEKWGLNKWQIFLDSPMAIEATDIYLRHHQLYDTEAAQFWKDKGSLMGMPNLHFSRTSKDSMAINKIQDGAIIIAGSGMMTGGRIKHHIKHNIWRSNCHLIVTGYQSHGTMGRKLVEGAKKIRLWGERVRVKARIHTIGGLSAHTDQRGLMDWYGNFKSRPPVFLVHGEASTMEVLKQKLRDDLNAPAHIADNRSIDLLNLEKYNRLE
ncbi:MBL fold metallo-hydrolase [Chromatiales bacterium (ex Bugula neritina AB1)]|nr:MBL fold metallo-hydrolase [Chromatiales bacterium (ex Bugula neritina AB1)]